MGQSLKQNTPKMFPQETQQNLPSREQNQLPAEDSRDLQSINPIRTETVFSRFPIHQLSKKTSTPIRIIRRNSQGGQVTFRWETSPNAGYGTPRQLAFKADKLVVDRRLHELDRPLTSRYVRLGSLRDIARQLNLGGNTNKAKRALLQNAFIAISAKLTYTTREGTEQSVEEVFTRYNLRFWREKLEDGTDADSVYLRLNDPFFQIINTSPTRPLDYDYLKLLPPAAQRLYELASYKVFAALKYGHSHFKIRYSEHCLLAPQTRSFQLWKVKRQMEPIHKQHLASHYITDVRYQKTTDINGGAKLDHRAAMRSPSRAAQN